MVESESRDRLYCVLYLAMQRLLSATTTYGWLWPVLRLRGRPLSHNRVMMVYGRPAAGQAWTLVTSQGAACRLHSRASQIWTLLPLFAALMSCLRPYPLGTDWL